MPTTAFTPRPLNERISERQNIQETSYSLATIASTIGSPQINLPFADVEGAPVGLSLLGPSGSDEVLMELAGRLERVFRADGSSGRTGGIG